MFWISSHSHLITDSVASEAKQARLPAFSSFVSSETPTGHSTTTSATLVKEVGCTQPPAKRGKQNENKYFKVVTKRMLKQDLGTPSNTKYTCCVICAYMHAIDVYSMDAHNREYRDKDLHDICLNLLPLSFFLPPGFDVKLLPLNSVFAPSNFQFWDDFSMFHKSI